MPVSANCSTIWLKRNAGGPGTEVDRRKLRPEAKEDEDKARRRLFILQIMQPGLAGLMDGSVSTLAPVLAAALATRNSGDAFLVGLAASLGAGISMGFAEALSDDGTLTGRGHPWARGLVCGAMTALGGIGHTLPFLIPRFHAAMTIAFLVVLVELAVITLQTTRKTEISHPTTNSRDSAILVPRQIVRTTLPKGRPSTR
jgi:hypothetical protein